MSDCLFCKIVKGEIPSKKIFESDAIYAFEDIAPRAPTHILVVPKMHVGRLSEATDTESVGRLLLAAARIARDRDLSDYRVVINNGEGAGQTVFHLHVHLLGGRPMAWPPG